MDEFSLIRTIFQRPELTTAGGHLDKGIGDDCALVPLSSDQQLVQSVDTLVEGVHFPVGGDPFLIGYRSLAVSVSDLAAMGATPHSFFLALTLPKADPKWLKPFSDGLAVMAKEAEISLAGGDTTRGPLTISVHVQGFVPKGRALMRSGARPGDMVYVSGSLGEASAALPYVLNQKTVVSQDEQRLVDRYWQPTPRIKLGQWLLENGATAAIDISDGLVGDLGHILKASGCGVELDSSGIPISRELKKVCGEKALDKALFGGDDYELCFCLPADFKLPTAAPESVRCIGQLTDNKGAVLINNQPLSASASSYQHF